MNDLWPNDLIDGTDTLMPVSIFVEQAKLLGQHTKNIVTAEVKPSRAGSDPKFIYNFDLRVELLKYSFTLMSLRHGVDGFPAVIYPYHKIASELDNQEIDFMSYKSRGIKVENETELKEALRKVLQAETTKNIIRNLIAQTRQFNGVSNEAASP